MAGNKKTFENPPAKLKAAVLKGSVAPIWEDAVREYCFHQYYCSPKGLFSLCCSPREIKNQVVIINIHNKSTLVVCNACAERYFGIVTGQLIGNAVRKLKRNIDWGMNTGVLDYLLAHRVISEDEYNNYEIALLKRDSQHLYSNLFKAIRKEINSKLLVYTDIENKVFFHTADYMLGTSAEFPRLDIAQVIHVRQETLRDGNAAIWLLHDIMNRTGGDGSFYNEKVKNQLLDDFFKEQPQNTLKRRLDISEYRDIITLFKPLDPFEEVEGEWEIIRPQKQKKEFDAPPKSTYPKFTPYELEHLGDGLEEEPIDLNDEEINYDEAEEWDDSNFDDDEFSLQASLCDSLLEDFFEHLLDWIKREMEKRDYEPNRLKTNKNSGMPYPYEMQQVLDFVDIEELKVAVFRCRMPHPSLCDIMEGAGCSIKYTYQILDWLMRQSDKEIREFKLKKIKKILLKDFFTLIHDDKITRIERTKKYKEEVKRLEREKWTFLP